MENSVDLTFNFLPVLWDQWSGTTSSSSSFRAPSCHCSSCFDTGRWTMWRWELQFTMEFWSAMLEPLEDSLGSIEAAGRCSKVRVVWLVLWKVPEVSATFAYAQRQVLAALALTASGIATVGHSRVAPARCSTDTTQTYTDPLRFYFLIVLTYFDPTKDSMTTVHY